jgi:hypothetical protein
MRLRDTGVTIANPKDDLRGRMVIDALGAQVGKITALIVDREERRVRFLQVALGGFLRFARTTTFIPVEVIISISPTSVQIDRTGALVATAPTYDPEFIDDLALFARTWGHYELTPYWTPPRVSRERESPNTGSPSTGGGPLAT